MFNRHKNLSPKSLKIKLLKKIFFLLVFLILLLGGFYFIKSDFFAVKKINIETDNLSCVDEGEIKTALDFFGKNIFFIDLKKKEDGLKIKFICIRNIDFSKSYPDSLDVKVSGRRPEIIFVNSKLNESSGSAIEKIINTPSSQSADIFEGGEEYILDSEGVIFGKDGVNLNKVYVFLDISVGEKIEQILVENLIKIFEKIKDFGINNPDFVLESENLIIINTSPMIELRINGGIDNQLAALQLILEKAKIDNASIEFIDLRFDKPIVKYSSKNKDSRE